MIKGPKCREGDQGTHWSRNRHSTAHLGVHSQQRTGWGYRGCWEPLCSKWTGDNEAEPRWELWACREAHGRMGWQKHSSWETEAFVMWMSIS
jgi:hypothetical protein